MKTGIELEQAIGNQRDGSYLPLAPALTKALNTPGVYTGEPDLSTIEFSTQPHNALSDLEREVQEHHTRLQQAAAEHQALLIPIGLPIAQEPHHPSQDERYVRQRHDRRRPTAYNAGAQANGIHINVEGTGDSTTDAWIYNAAQAAVPLLTDLGSSSSIRHQRNGRNNYRNAFIRATLNRDRSFFNELHPYMHSVEEHDAHMAPYYPDTNEPERLGGLVRIRGGRDTGKPWRIEIRAPDANTTDIAVAEAAFAKGWITAALNDPRMVIGAYHEGALDEHAALPAMGDRYRAAPGTIQDLYKRAQRAGRRKDPLLRSYEHALLTHAHNNLTPEEQRYLTPLWNAFEHGTLADDISAYVKGNGGDPDAGISQGLARKAQLYVAERAA